MATSSYASSTDHLDHPPLGRETLIGPDGFGLRVIGESMAGRDIHDGDSVWVNPDRPYRANSVVLALVTADIGGEASMLVKTFARTKAGDCLLSEAEADCTPVTCAEFRVIGPVVGITSWRTLPPPTRALEALLARGPIS